MKTYKALSIRQPWAQMIVDGIKPVENRSWKTDYRGPLLIHAGLRYDPQPDLEQAHDIDASTLTLGAFIGVADLTDIVDEHASPFFDGPFGWVLKNPRRIRPIPAKGRLSIFAVKTKLEFI